MFCIHAYHLTKISGHILLRIICFLFICFFFFFEVLDYNLPNLLYHNLLTYNMGMLRGG